MSKVAAFYYTQTGQGLKILQSICSPLAKAGYEVVYKEIVPKTAYPFPWSSDAFFQAFPESRQGIPCEIQAIDLSDIADADLVIVEYQSWFLSPSIPVSGFFQDAAIQHYLKGKSVITVNGCRNMWIMAQQKIKFYLAQSGGKLVGNIVLQDHAPNLVSVITVVRWLLYGKQAKSGLFPAAGVSPEDIEHAAVFGQTISDALAAGDFSRLQEKLMQQNAIEYKPSIAFVEKTGHRIFGVLSKWVLRKGAYNAPERNFRLQIFKHYLFFVLYVVSPIGLLLFYIAYPFRCKSIREDKLIQCSV
ncbi:dialkylrecorsinol condensing protein DarA [Bacteroidia bacterium]|nr:dialkylrecorsinol condensing protein DarA [Bacteroidia bacterium]